MSAFMADAARAYAAAGYHVIPLHGITNGACTCRAGARCESAGKHPRWSGWQGEADRNGANPDFVGGLFTRSVLNLGLRGLGHGCAVLDGDTPDAVAELERLAGAGGPLAGAPVATTRRGLHVYVATAVAPGEIRPGLELKSENIVAPPSINPDGTVREWWPGRSILDCSPVPLPSELRPKGASRIDRATGGGPLHETHGRRNDSLFGLGCAMRRWGCAEETIHAALRAENALRCKPPLHEDEVTLIVRSLRRYKPARWQRGDGGRA
ncbi:MAG TPA: bifunctional DNA primase/polymerase [Miltoncostaeaceae bacterium]|nr:bifunctional DNA primase/polymerase [Miltoncostaeaceae bacterium]